MAKAALPASLFPARRPPPTPGEKERETERDWQLRERASYGATSPAASAALQTRLSCRLTSPADSGWALAPPLPHRPTPRPPASQISHPRLCCHPLQPRLSGPASRWTDAPISSGCLPMGLLVPPSPGPRPPPHPAVKLNPPPWQTSSLRNAGLLPSAPPGRRSPGGVG